MIAGLGAALLLLAACGDGRAERGPARDTAAPAAGAADPAPDAEDDRMGTRPSVVFLGTSLTAGLGVEPEEAYPARIQEKIDSAGLPFRVVNAGVSGETSAGARRRVDWVLRQPVTVLVVETGANDGLRGLSPEQLRENLDAILERAGRQEPAPALVVVQMEAPPNYGARYTESFRRVYAEAAREHGATLVPFLLGDVAGIDSLNQADGIHPTPSGHRRMAETVWRALQPLLRERAAG